MPSRRSRSEELAAQRSRRNEFYDRGVTPSGDKRLNPDRKRTAYEYDQWRHTTPSHHMEEGAFLNQLESEEKSSGQWSYPAGHPRRVALEAGKDPDMEDLKARGAFRDRPGASSSPAEPLDPQTGQMTLHPVSQRTTKVSSATRTNRWESSCERCGEPVAPGEGRVEKNSSGQWSTTHLNER